MSDFQKAFGKNLRELRRHRAMTQETLAEKSELSLQHVGAIERGVGNPTLNSVERIANALDISIGELFVLDGFNLTPEKLRKELMNRVASVSDEKLLNFYIASRFIL